MTLKFQINIAKNRHTIISIDHFEIPENQITFLFGESGIGKSLISKAIYGLLDPNVLQITVNQHPYARYLAQKTTNEFQKNGFFVFQEPSSHLNPLLKLGEQLKEGSLSHSINESAILHHLWGQPQDAAIQNLLEVYPGPYRPSGGEKQRILLAMAFKKIRLLKTAPSSKALFVFDEPTGSLDNHFRNLFLKLLFEYFQKQPFTGILITHDYSMISEVYKHYAHLRAPIAFKELSRQNGHLILQDFAATTYLEWLKKGLSAPARSEIAEKPIFTVKGGYEIFGKKMIISRDQTRRSYGSLSIKRGEMAYLKAASGIGKTTLAKIIMGLQPCRHLNMQIGNLEISAQTPPTIWPEKLWGKKLGMVFQHADEALNLNATVKEIFHGLPVPGRFSSQQLRQHLNLLFEKNDNAFLNKRVALLSGGQKQRLNLLRTFILNTDLLILDEPLNGLDFQSIRKVIAVLQQKQREGRAILLVSHNEEIFDTLIPRQHVYYLFGS